MTLREKLGQLIMYGFPGTEPGADVLRLVKEYKAGNICLFSHNIENIEQLKHLCQTLRCLTLEQCGILPIISVDQEGGVVARLPEKAVSFPSAMAVAATGEVNNAYLAGLYTGQELAALGINCNLAPVLDCNTNPDNPVIGVRSYGSRPWLVAEYGLAMAKGQQEAGILSVAKHFPGHGDTAVDSHLGLPVVNKSEQELLHCELIPFVEAIRAKLPSIMVAHILFPQLDKSGVPASMSPVMVQGLLRERLGYDGLVMTDCLEMGAVQDHFGTPEGFVSSLIAGVDIGVVSHTPALAIRSLQLAEEAVAAGDLPVERVDEALNRVLRCKQEYGTATAKWELVGSPTHRQAALWIMEQAVSRLDELGDLPPVDTNTLFVGCLAYRSTFASSSVKGAGFPEVMAQVFGGQGLVVPVEPGLSDTEKAVGASRPGQTVVVGSYNGHINPGQLELAKELSRQGRKVIVVALRNPYDLLLLPPEIYKLAAFEYTPLSFLAVEKVLAGGLAMGRLKEEIFTEGK